MATMGSGKQKVWKQNMILHLISTIVENVQWQEFKWGFKIQGVQAYFGRLHQMKLYMMHMEIQCQYQAMCSINVSKTIDQAFTCVFKYLYWMFLCG